MQSLLLKETDKEKPEEDNEMDTRPHQRQQRTTARALSLPTTRHTQMTTLPDMRREVFLPDFLLLHCTRTRDQIVDCLAVHLEPLVRSAVREELRPVFDFFKDFIRPQRLLPDRDTEARYRLHFINGVKDPTFTDDPVTDNKGAPIEVAIYDSHTRSIIPPDCFLSSAKVRMTVLNAELWKSKGGNWTTSEFNNSILKKRDGKGPILTGAGLTFRLQNGRGTFGNIVFKDNSSWTKSGFCLGVVIEVEGEADVERVQEAVSEPFRVKDRRGKASQKPDLLKLTDKVQSIKNIGKDRVALLEKNNINLVENFLLSYYTDQHELRTILGIKSESDKGWKNMVEHAMECDDEFQAKYNVPDSGAHPQQVSVGQQVNIVNTSMDQPYADVPVDSNTNLVPPQEVLHGSYFHQEQFCNSSEAMQMFALNVHVPPVPGICYVGSGSSVPNPYEDNLTSSGFAEVLFPNAESACVDIRHTSQLQQNMAENTIPCDDEFQAGYNTSNNMGLLQQVTVTAHPNWDPISVTATNNSTFSVSPTEEGGIRNQDLFDICSAAFAHMPERSVHPETTVGPRVVGSSSSGSNPLENYFIKPVTGLQFEIPIFGPDPMEDMLANTESSPNNYCESQPTSGSKKRKVKTIFLVAFLASPRKKARQIS